ncbi:hypothetical protein ED733_004652 [Metarhizium rileyi]|uniref:Protein kinase domain-containing protein n=1 Tax=Metarhizium rileyi (strain RCEF 4871) TaxID=1649241 RepID=A0A5C6GHI2_METRR|nr:hypothetical protein ED733_004652 [Metarhizium rileyi]
MEAIAAPVSEDQLAAGMCSPRLTIHHVDDGEDVGDRSRTILSTTVSESPTLQSYSSPMRHHKRTPSAHREIKETLNARVEFTSDEVDGRTYHRINQYVIVEEIGRGSYGAVHRATDQFGNEFAVKEFSKSRLRKRAQSHILRLGPQSSPGQRPPRPRRAAGPLSPQLTGLRAGEENDALFLIREEIAIMKKLNHPNLVQLIEVLDDPEEDSLYMVMEMCKKGVIMTVGLDDNADPYSDETCRYWFRDLLLGIEYYDEVLKIVDFGVSEMFDKPDNMKISKSAGSPAFMPPELCGKHREVSGKAADMWSMGVTLYCLKYGKIPFNRPTVLEIYEAIKECDLVIPVGEDPAFVDLMGKILEKDPEKRITMPELREHPWVTKGSHDPLLSAEDNCEHIIEPPNELELSRAFTRKMNHLLSMMKAIHKFKTLLARIRARKGTSVNSSSASLQLVMSEDESLSAADEEAKAGEIEALVAHRRHMLSHQDEDADKGHAREVGDQEPLFLGIGTGARDAFARDEASPDVVADSPTAVDFDVYDRAYEEAIKRRMRAKSSKKPTMYLTRFVKETDYFKKIENLVEGSTPPPASPDTELKQATQVLKDNLPSEPGAKLAEIIDKVALSAPESKT